MKGRVLQVLPVEKSLWFSYGGAMTLCTFYEGRAPTAYLRARVAELVTKNPWLGARLATREGANVLLYDDEEHPELFEEHDPQVVRFARQMAYFDLFGFADAFIVKSAAQGSINDPNAPQFKVSVIPDSNAPGERFALVVSINRVIGDGHTFYKLYNMLGNDAVVEALDATRKQDIHSRQREMMGTKEADMMMSPLAIAHIVSGLLQKALGFKTEICLNGFDSTWLKDQKTVGARADVPFVSSNDVIVSNFLQAAQPVFAHMAVNFRARIANCLDADAGNYDNALTYRQADWESPQLIRQSVKGLRRAALPRTQLPSLRDCAFGTSGACCNLASFYTELRLDGCEERLHLPLLDPASVLPNSVGCIIFRPTKGELAAMIYGALDSVRLVSESGMLGDPLSL